MIWEVWCDGSCKCVSTERGVTPKGGVGYGGWAAIVEHGSDGFVLRGRETGTTNVEMELRAMIEGLREVTVGERVILHTDSTVALSVRERWQRGDRLLPHRAGLRQNGRPVHWKLWVELMAEYDRVEVEIRLVGKGPNAVHSRAHAYAGAEARAGAGNLPRHVVPLDDADRRILGDRFRREVREWRDRQSRVTARPLPSSTS